MECICRTPGMYLADIYERMVSVEVEAKGRSWGLVKILSVYGCWNRLKCQAGQFAYSVYGLLVTLCFPCHRFLIATYPLIYCQSGDHHVTEQRFSGKVWGWTGSAWFKWPSTGSLQTFISQKLSISEELAVLGVLQVPRGDWPWVHLAHFSVVSLTVLLLLLSAFPLFPLGTGMPMNSHPCDHHKLPPVITIPLSCSFFTVPMPLAVMWFSDMMCWTQTGRQELRGPSLTTWISTSSQVSVSALIKCLTTQGVFMGELSEELH